MPPFAEKLRTNIRIAIRGFSPLLEIFGKLRITDQLFVVSIVVAPLFFLSIRKWSNIALFVASFLAIASLIQDRKNSELSKADRMIVLIFSLPIISIGLSHALRGTFDWADFDAPLRVALAGLIFANFRKLGIQFLPVLVMSASLGMLLIPLFIDPKQTINFGGRIATAHADTNVLGGYLALLLGMTASWLVVQTDRLGRLNATILPILGFISGGILLVQTMSRGGWVVAAIMLFLTILIYPYIHRRIIVACFLIFGIIAFGAGNVTNSEKVQQRLVSVLKEPYDFIKKESVETTSTSERISMIMISWELFKKEPVSGHKKKDLANAIDTEWLEKRNLQIAFDSLTSAGPHNTFLAYALNAGSIGLISILIFFMTPFVIFWRDRKTIGLEKTALLGIVTLTGIIVLQFFVESFGLKFTAFFTAMMLAVVLADHRNLKNIE